MSNIERAYDLEAVVAAHRAAKSARGSWTRLSDMEYDAIAGTAMRQQREGAVEASVIRHWVVKNMTGKMPAFVIYDEEAAAGYAAVTEHWNVEGPFVPADQLAGAVEALNEFRDGLTEALNAHGVPAQPSWREAIDWLARHGGQ